MIHATGYGNGGGRGIATHLNVTVFLASVTTHKFPSKKLKTDAFSCQ
jgi:hypothetical protein